MNIALLGYGRMGKEIEKIALQRGHQIVIKNNGVESYDISKADIAIDFSIPSAAFKNISYCINNTVPVISGTTGWLDRYNDIIDLCHQKKGAFIYASNFSLGVTIFFELNKKLALMMDSLKDYTISLEEIHHLKKLDAPSGTAITLAEGIIENSSKTTWKLDKNVTKDTISINANRIANIPGTHIVNYTSEADEIQIKHRAKNRSGFALGAVIAAEWLLHKKGVYTMKDVLNIG